MTKQPFSGPHCLPPQPEEGARKGALNIVCHIHSGQPNAADGDPLLRSKIKEN